MLVEWGIDVSAHNGQIDYKKLAKYGCKFVIIRDGLGWGTTKGKDSLLEYHYDAAKTAGLKTGFYHYIWETTADGILKEFEQCCRNINGKSAEMGVYADIERNEHFGLSSKVISALCENWISNCYWEGYKAGIYMSDSLWTKVDSVYQSIKYYTRWVAHWGIADPPDSKGLPLIWQSDVMGMDETSTLKGQLPGCNGPVDINWVVSDGNI